MRVWVVGAGAIGCMVGARLARSEDVVFIDAWKTQVDAINQHGLRVDYYDETVVVHPNAYALIDLPAIAKLPDVVLLSVKSNQTANTVERLAPHLPATTSIVSVQNGMNEETIAAIVGGERTVGAMVTGDSAMVEPGHAVAKMPKRRLVIGELDGSESMRIHTLSDLLSKSLPTTWTNNVMGQLWTKLVRNCMLNALGAITGFAADEIARDPVARRIALALGREAVRVATAEGVVLDPTLLEGDPAGYLAEPGSPAAAELENAFAVHFGSLPGVKSSMLQDVLRGRPTEVDFLNGYVALKGTAADIETPFNERIRTLVHQVESGARASDDEWLRSVPRTEELRLDDRAILELLPSP